MFAGAIYTQITFVELGYKKKEWGLLVGMLASVAFITVILILIYLWR